MQELIYLARQHESFKEVTHAVSLAIQSSRCKKKGSSLSFPRSCFGFPAAFQLNRLCGLKSHCP